MPIDFSRNLIKGRIAEVVFEQMIREEGKYVVIPFGYEHTVPTLAQFRNLAEIPSIIDNIADAPDFALVSEDKKKIYLVEVKYQRELDKDKIQEYASDLLKHWEYPWIFVATPEGFYCGLCSTVLKENKIEKLSENWVHSQAQEKYLKLLKEFL